MLRNWHRPTKVDEHWDKSLRELAGEAALEAKAEAQVSQVESIYVGNMMSGVANQQGQLGSMVADWIGQRFTDAVKIESACSSGSAAFPNGLSGSGLRSIGYRAGRRRGENDRFTQ